MLYKYLLELKNRLCLLVITWSSTVLVCYYYKETLLFFLIKFNSMLYNTYSFYFITTSLMDLFNVYIKLSCFISLQFTVIIFLYHILLFFSPGLFLNEFKVIKSILFLIVFFFVVSSLVFHNFILPYTWFFFISYQTNQLENGLNIFFETQIVEYLNFYLEFYYISIFVGQIFVIMFIYLNLVHNKFLFIKKTRKLVYSSFLIFSTIVTPPDIFSQFSVTLFLCLIYEITIIFAILKQKF